VIYLKVHREWSFNHLIARADKEGRKDDTESSINRRLDWFDNDVLPTINHYRRDRDYDFIEVNGERSVDEVHQEIIARVF
jgi:adenylate kinase family enzyme